MSLFTKIRNTVTGTVVPAVASVFPGVSGILGGLTGALGNPGPLPMQDGGQMQNTTGNTSGDMGYQQSLAGLMQMIGQQPQLNSGNSGGGLI